MGHHVLLLVGEVAQDGKVAFFNTVDVLLDTQVKDGLNLGPFEYVACHKQDRRG
jgi:trehalose-6-phosphate synthase